MKRFLMVAALVAAAFTTPVLAADIGVSLSIGQPGFYGRLDIGGYPEPQVVYPQPRIIERVGIGRPPIYLLVPPGHAKNWRKHCSKYNACGEQVFFVHDTWYEREYVPRYQERHRDRRDGHPGNSKNKKDSKGRDRDHDRGGR